MSKTKKRSLPLITIILIIGAIVVVSILIWNSAHLKKVQEIPEEKEGVQEIPEEKEPEIKKDTSKRTALTLEEKKELTSLCSEIDLSFEETCWDDERFFLTLKNTGEDVIKKLRLLIWGENKACMGEGFAEEGIKVGDEKTYLISYNKESLGVLNHFEVVRFIDYKDKKRGCEPIKNEFNMLPNKCTTPISEIVPSESIIIGYVGECDIPKNESKV